MQAVRIVEEKILKGSKVKRELSKPSLNGHEGEWMDREQYYYMAHAQA